MCSGIKIGTNTGDKLLHLLIAYSGRESKISEDKVDALISHVNSNLHRLSAADSCGVGSYLRAILYNGEVDPSTIGMVANATISAIIGAIFSDCEDLRILAKAIRHSGLVRMAPLTIDPSCFTSSECQNEATTPIAALLDIDWSGLMNHLEQCNPVLMEPDARKAGTLDPLTTMAMTTSNDFVLHCNGSQTMAEHPLLQDIVTLTNFTSPITPDYMTSTPERHLDNETTSTNQILYHATGHGSNLAVLQSTSLCPPLGNDNLGDCLSLCTTLSPQLNPFNLQSQASKRTPGIEKNYQAIIQALMIYPCSSQALLKLQDALTTPSQSDALSKALAGQPMSAKHRLTIIELAEGQLARMSIVRRYHVFRLWQDYPNAAVQGSFHIEQHGPKSVSKVGHNGPRNPLTAKDMQTNERMMEELHPYLERGSNQYAATYEKLKRLKRLGQRLEKFVECFGPGILGLLPCSEYSAMFSSSVNITDNMLLNVAMTDYNRLLSSLSQDQADLIRRFSSAVEPIVLFLVGESEKPRGMLLETVEPEEIADTRNTSEALLRLVAQSDSMIV